MGRDTLTRRAFLAGGSSAAVLVAAGRAEAIATPRPRGAQVRFGVRSPFPTKDLRERALLLGRLGYEGIELDREHSARPLEEIRADLDGTGIAVSAIVGSLKLLDPDPEVRGQAVETTRRRLELAQGLGAVGVIEVPVFGASRLAEPTGRRRQEDQLLVQAFRSLAPAVRRTGVKILIEPLTKKETYYMNLQSHGARIISRVGARGFHLLSDFYHMQMEEDDIGKCLARHGRHTAYVHLADGEARTEPGSLPFDYRPGFRSLKRHGFSGWLTVECRASDSPEAALARALPYLRRQWAEA